MYIIILDLETIHARILTDSEGEVIITSSWANASELGASWVELGYAKTYTIFNKLEKH